MCPHYVPNGYLQTSPWGSHHCPQECQLAGVGNLPRIFGWLPFHSPTPSPLFTALQPWGSIPVAFVVQSDFLFWFAGGCYGRKKGSGSRWLIFWRSLRTTSLGHKTQISKDSGNLGKVELKLYLWVFKSGPVMAGVPDLLFQIILVNQTMTASYPGKGS